MKSKPNTSRWTLRRYLDEMFLPSKLAGGRIVGSTAGLYRVTVSQLNDYLRFDVRCRLAGSNQGDRGGNDMR
jgi:hypothetical protein